MFRREKGCCFNYYYIGQRSAQFNIHILFSTYILIIITSISLWNRLHYIKCCHTILLKKGDCVFVINYFLPLKDVKLPWFQLGKYHPCVFFNVIANDTYKLLYNEPWYYLLGRIWSYLQIQCFNYSIFWNNFWRL